MFRPLLILLSTLIGFQVIALESDAPFVSIDGGTLRLSDWSGHPTLVINTASRCSYTKQYSGSQDLYNLYRDSGLVVLAVPSDDFRQELASSAEVKDFCEMRYDIDMPMTGILAIKVPQAHPFFASLMADAGFEPAWNFNKILIGPDDGLEATYSSKVKPQSSRLKRDIEGLLK
jgi:glutathione peroxidase